VGSPLVNLGAYHRVNSGRHPHSHNYINVYVEVGPRFPEAASMCMVPLNLYAQDVRLRIVNYVAGKGVDPGQLDIDSAHKWRD